MSEWTIWAGMLTGCPFGVFRGRDGQAVSPFPFVLSFLGLRYRPAPGRRRCAEVDWMQVWLLEVHYPDILVAWCGMMS